MQRLILMCVTLCIADGMIDHIRWVDHFKADDQDIFFDRIVAITFDQEKKFRASGVLITRRLVLTTFNPFRIPLTTARENMTKIKIISLKTREILGGGEDVKYTYEESRIVCGRQVLPTDDAINVWHMGVGQQSPLNDLMVLKLANPILPRRKNESEIYAEFDFTENLTAIAGPIVSRLASGRARLGDDFKFASYGHLDGSHVKNGTVLRSFEFDYDDHARTDCDEWLPRGWGHFICINNIKNFPSIASGAVLVHKDFVFGLGSFYLEKAEDKSILVFTDVRPYLNLIYHTCLDAEKRP